MYMRVYEYPLRRQYQYRAIGFKGNKPRPADERAEPKENPWKLANSLSRSRRFIRDLILCNRFWYFCTFTFSAANIDRNDLEACKKAITKFFMNFRNRYAPNFIYIIVAETHQDGGWHFHGLVAGIPLGEFTVPDTIFWRDPRTEKLKEVKNTKGYVRWERYSKRFGFFDCSRIKHYEACAAYVSKYITKDLATLTKGKRLFMSSQGLERPELVFDEEGVAFIYDADYEDEYCRMAWLTKMQAMDTVLPAWHGEQCADLRDIDAELKQASKAEIEKLIFEPLTYEQMTLDYSAKLTDAQHKLLAKSQWIALPDEDV